MWTLPFGFEFSETSMALQEEASLFWSISTLAQVPIISMVDASNTNFSTISSFVGALACYFKKLMTGLMSVIRLIGCINKLTLPFQQTGLVWRKPWDWYVCDWNLLFIFSIYWCFWDSLILAASRLQHPTWILYWKSWKTYSIMLGKISFRGLCYSFRRNFILSIIFL